MKYLGLIPARGGSKRIPKKNMKLLHGKPLIYWTIKSAKESKLLNNIIVSTDDKEIEQYAKSLGVNVINRNKELSNDKVSLLPVMKHALSLHPADNIVLLRPTSPIREKDLIDKCIISYEMEESNSLATGFINKELEWPYKSKKIDIPSHSHDGWFQTNGCVDIYSKDCIEDEKIGENITKILTDEFSRLEVDNISDVIAIEAFMEYLNYE
jgi:N-acylneuraminate cytidylyltransferase